ncbi:MAG: twin-arginine translocation signal domain-containing protein [Patescibacteria group bacterium]
MKDQEPILNLYLSRRQFLGGVATGFAAGLTAHNILWPNHISAQSALEQALSAFRSIEVGKTTDEEVNSIHQWMNRILSPLYSSSSDPLPKRNMGQLIRYTMPSYLSGMDSVRGSINLAITQKDGVALFKRSGGGGKEDFMPLSQTPDTIIHHPSSREIYTMAPRSYYPQIWGPYNTHVFASRGIALVVYTGEGGLRDAGGIRGGDVTEIQEFVPSTVDGYWNMWKGGDYNPSSSLVERSCAIFLEGLGSRIRPGMGLGDGPFRYSDLPVLGYDMSAQFSYAGGEVIEFSNNAPPIWSPYPYEPSHTYQPIERSVDYLEDMIDKLSPHYNRIDFEAHSFGGNVLLRYFWDRILPPNGPHHNLARTRLALLLHSPVNGVPFEDFITYAQSAGILDLETQIGNPATAYLGALGRPEALEFTKAINTRSAKFLQERNGIHIFCFGNRGDKLVPPEYAIIPGFGEILDLGEANLGHSQLLYVTDDDARTRIFNTIQEILRN